MTDNHIFDVIIVGGSYSGLSAAMALGRSMRKVLIIDSGLPCNRQTPHSHNFITQDGKTPKEITAIAREQVARYPTVSFHQGLAVKGTRTDPGFELSTAAGATFRAQKLVFATGIKDLMPDIKGFAECWGISVIHCPYCHGYEVKGEVTGILANGEAAMHYALLVSNLTKKLSIFTNGKAEFSEEQLAKLAQYHIAVVEDEIEELVHNKGKIEQIIFKNGTSFPLKALYARTPFVQHSDIPEQLGCALNEQGFLKIDAFQQTTEPGIWACGDNASFMRSVANAVATGNFAGAMVNKELCEAQF